MSTHKSALRKRADDLEAGDIVQRSKPRSNPFLEAMRGWLDPDGCVHVDDPADMPVLLDRLAQARPEQDEAVRAAADSMEQLLWSYDWLGTGSDQRAANKDERIGWDQWSVIRRALGLGEPKDRP